MTSSQQAKILLQEIEQTEQRGRALLGYWRYGALAQIWGAVWAFAYLGDYFFPGHANWFWLIGDGIGLAASMLISSRHEDKASDKRAIYAFGLLIVFGLVASSLLANKEAAGLVWTWLFMTPYMIWGLWFGKRWFVLGATIVTLSALAYCFLTPWFQPAMAILAGGGLMLGGQWLRRAR
ncbi:hypothetical protein [Chromobacterium sp. IIBBL 290-4]|uniref:hypothetical protein n=1 Tax=Chromobacterium sp. IIBBL 290-4 TaxID=2953890 RepID=UPI0020B76FE4|nr:hypothetical protein [Chromobacterium sp. IIBBL 290-4]UTH74293.1 hypothetical protein NKT35_22605 [Chromobacterium sp. IIBBL 290-4]